MKPIQVTKFEAADGTVWDTEKECKAHEGDTLSERVSTLAKSEIEGAMRYDPSLRQLAADLEAVGRKCAEARIAAGDVKRKRKGKDDGAPRVDQKEPEAVVAPNSGPAVTSESERVLTKYAGPSNYFPSRNPGQVSATNINDEIPV